MDQLRQLKAIHLCSGSGGGILGGALLNQRPICAVEINPSCRSTLEDRIRDGILPWFPIWDDLRTFRGTQWAELADIVCAGWPCQDISCAGKGKGLDGKRSGLWTEVSRIINEIGPRYVFLENSPRITSRGLDRVLMDLAKMGYDAKWCVLGADAVGLPHHRARFWMVAHAQWCPKREEPCSWAFGRVGWQRKPLEGHRDWEDYLLRAGRSPSRLARRVDRTDAIRNGQVPAVAATAWTILNQ